MDTDIHAVENKWWPVEAKQITSFPVTSMLYMCAMPEEGLLSVHVAQHECVLPERWRPILILIEMCQLHAFGGTSDSDASHAYLCLELVLWYDSLRQYIVEEAKKHPDRDNDWIPDAVHRFCVRVQLGKSHQPEVLKEDEDELNRAYATIKRWSYGMVPFTGLVK